MNRRSMIGVAAVAIASLVLPAATLAAATVGNGSFEDVAVTNPAFDTLAAGSTDLAPWTVDSGSVDLIGNYWTAADGQQSLDLNGTEAGAISQTLTTVIGATYVVSFEMSGNPDTPDVKSLTVSATGGPTDTKSFDVAATGATASDMKWSTETYSFTASSTTSTLTFQSTTSGAQGPALDHITVTETLATPTTKASCKALGWAMLTDASATAFRNQGDCVSYVATGGKNTAAGPVAHGASATAHAAADVRKSSHVASASPHRHSASDAARHKTSHKAKSHAKPGRT